MRQDWEQQSDRERVDYIKDMLATFIELFSDHTRRIARLEATLSRLGVLDEEIDRAQARSERQDRH